jgi:serine/threonine protein kinase
MIGKIVSHYQILEKLGEGGMGVVYKAEDTKLKRTVALKFLPPELTRDPEAKERFIREAQAASALQHHHICTIHDIDETPDGQLFIVMDCYAGETLKQKISRGPLEIGEAIDLALQIANGLERAHEEGIIHRDIKPANTIVTDRGEVKILDFGLAKLAGQAQLTKDNSTLGTVAYMSPEQLG